jgi:3-dehydroquinate synthase
MMDKKSPFVPKAVTEMWESLSPEVRNALIASELKVDASNIKQQQQQERDRSESTTPTVLSRSSSEQFFEQNSSCESFSKDDNSTRRDKCPVSGATVLLTPVERAPKNVFAFTKTHTIEKSEVVKTSSATVTTTTKVVSTSRGWRNVFSVPISYDVNMVAHGTLFDDMNSQLLDATGVHPEGYNTRFAVVDTEVEALYGENIRSYFERKGIELTVCVINGGEADKRSKVRL